MKMLNIRTIACAAFLGLGLSSCSDYLDCPTEDTYNTGNYYKDDNQCRAGVNYLYNSPWYDFQRGFFKVGEVLSGNFYWGGSPYLTFTLDGSDQDLANMSAALWSVNTPASTVMANIKSSTGPSQAVKNYSTGECLVWKSMAYFYLVRSFGAVPIINDPVEIINNQTATKQRKAKISNIYDYIVMMLKQAIELLPEKDTTKKGRIDKYAAKGLLAKVYLTKAGFSEENTTYPPGSYSYITCTPHQRNAEDLANAAKYALDVIENSGRKLETNYSDIFRGDHNICDEALISWAWRVGAQWTSQNSLQSDLFYSGFCEQGSMWGGWNGPSVDLQDAFGENALSASRQNTDTRRKATMMMAGDTYDYFYTDEPDGFNLLKFVYNGYANHTSEGQWECPTGAQEVKHLYGDAADHKKYIGTSDGRMASGLYTHLLRLSDVYLIYCEAIMGNSTSTNDAKALQYFYDVRHRGISSYEKPTSITWEDVWKERRLELACEGDRWYDFVRRYYYDPQGAIDEIKAQRRSTYSNLDALYKEYYTSGNWNAADCKYDENAAVPNVTHRSFTLPLPTSDTSYNPLLLEAPEDFDLSTIKF